MRVGFVLLGFALGLAATALQALGHHDGVLDATPAAEFPAAGHAGLPVMTRLVIDGTPATTQSYLAELRDRGTVATPALPLLEGTYVTARIDGPGPSMVVLLETSEPSPMLGEVVVVEGHARTVVLSMGAEGTAQILWIRAEQVREPILFKEA